MPRTGRPRRWSDRRIIAALKRDSKRRGHSPVQFDWIRGRATRPTAKTAIERFGSWEKALAAAGLEARQPRRSRPCRASVWTRETILARMREWRRENAEWPNTLAWKHSGPDWPVPATVLRVLKVKSWPAAVAMAEAEAEPSEATAPGG
jgi:hypothetical protein